MAKFVRFRDTCSWHIGWYPTEDDWRQFSMQHIYGWCWNVDVMLSAKHDWRISWRQRNYGGVMFRNRERKGLVIERA
jgi:hypothetical protein